MSDLSARDGEFTRVLQMLEDEHYREIWQLRQEHAAELDQLHHQVASLELQADPEQDQHGTVPKEESTSNSLNVLAQPFPTSSQEDNVVAAAQAHLSTHAVGRQTSPGDPLEGANGLKTTSSSIMKKKVTTHFEQQRSTSNFDKVAAKLDNYAKAKGWEQDTQIVMRGRTVGTVEKVVEHQAFDLVCALAICLNTALMGAVTSFHASVLGTEKLPDIYKILGWIFSCWFFIELTLRWMSEGFIAFLLPSPNWRWNLFDIMVVGIDLAEIATQLFTEDGNDVMGNLSIMRMLRVARFARALRVIRLLKFCRDLRVMVQSLLKSGMMLLWCFVLLSLIFFIFSIFIMQAVTEHLIAQAGKFGSSDQAQRFPKGSVEEKMDQCFGTLTMTIYMLFQSVAGGISWGELADMLKEAGPGNAVMFCLFIFFTVFAMLNVINGFFVDAAMSSVKTDEDEVVREEMKSENSLMRQLHNLFEEADTEKRGWITEKQFTELIENQRVNALLKGMGLNLAEAQGIFALLDLEVTGQVFIEDFIIGFMRLRGGAQEVDLVSLMYESRKILTSHSNLLKFVKSEFQSMDKFKDCVMSTLHRLVTGQEANTSRLTVI